MVPELLDLSSLHRKYHSPALIRGRTQGLKVDVDSPDSSGHWRDRLLGTFWGDFWTAVWTHSSSFQAADRAAQRARWVEAGGFLGAEKSSTMCWGSCCTRDQLWFVTNKLSSLLNRKSTLLQRKDSAEREESSTVVRTPGINLSKMYLQNTYRIFFCINEKYAAAWQGTSFHQLRFIRKLIFFQLPMSFPELTAKNPP